MICRKLLIFGIDSLIKKYKLLSGDIILITINVTLENDTIKLKELPRYFKIPGDSQFHLRLLSVVNYVSHKKTRNDANSTGHYNTYIRYLIFVTKRRNMVQI